MALSLWQLKLTPGHIGHLDMPADPSFLHSPEQLTAVNVGVGADIYRYMLSQLENILSRSHGETWRRPGNKASSSYNGKLQSKWKHAMEVKCTMEECNGNEVLMKLTSVGPKRSCTGALPESLSYTD